MRAIRFLKRKEIDERKWNDCIVRSSNSLPYALCWYLDSVAENWDALIADDYEAVMPVVWLRKFGIKCLYQPYYCQQLGLFGNNLSRETQQEFFWYITNHYSYININLNPTAKIISGEFDFKRKKNLLFSLDESYVQLKKNYSENHKRNIKKAMSTKIIFSEGTDLKQFQRFYLENVNRKKENFKSKHEKIFKRLTQATTENESGKIFSAINESNELLAASMVVRHHKRLINIINTSSAAGKNNGASHFLFDKIIQKYAGEEMILDFEGSSIPSIARFYEGFGAEEEIFYNYHTTILGKRGQRFL